MTTTSLRTQITLPKALREQIDAARQITGESLSGYLQKAAEMRLTEGRRRQVDVNMVADQVIGSIKSGDGGWGNVDLEEWHRERQEEDDYREQRLHQKVSGAVKKQHTRSSNKSSAFTLHDK